jgi:hypothetical protein
MSPVKSVWRVVAVLGIYFGGRMFVPNAAFVMALWQIWSVAAAGRWNSPPVLEPVSERAYESALRPPLD